MNLDYSGFKSTLQDLNLEIEEKLGAGAFGVVLRCRSTTDKRIYAVKIVELDDDDYKDDFLREVYLVSGLPQHPNIIGYHFSKTKTVTAGYAESTKLKIYKRSYLFIQMEFCAGGSLRQIIDKGTLKNSHVKMWEIFKGILMGLVFLHAERLIHRDLKPENLLLDSKDVPKIADFGLIARQDASKLTYGPGTQLYMAPEVPYGFYDSKVDIYSLGLVLFELYLSLGEESYVSVSATNNFREQKVFPVDFFKCGSEIENKPAQEIIVHMTKELPERRPSAQQLLHSLNSTQQDEEMYNLKECLDSAYITQELTKIREAELEGHHSECLELSLALVNSDVYLRRQELVEIIEACKALSLKIGDEKFLQTPVEEVRKHYELNEQVLQWLLLHVDIDLVQETMSQWTGNRRELLKRNGEKIGERFQKETMEKIFEQLQRFSAFHPEMMQTLFIAAQQINNLDLRGEYLRRIERLARAAEADNEVKLDDEQRLKSASILNRIASEIANIRDRNEILESAKNACTQLDFKKSLECFSTLIQKGLGLNSSEIGFLNDVCIPLPQLLALARSQADDFNAITLGKWTDKLQRLSNLFGVSVEDITTHSDLAVFTIQTVLSSDIVERRTLSHGQTQQLLKTWFKNLNFTDWNLEAPTDEALEKHIDRVQEICTRRHEAYYAWIKEVRELVDLLNDVKMRIRILSKFFYRMVDASNSEAFDVKSKEELEKTRIYMLDTVCNHPKTVVQMAQKARHNESYILALRLWNLMLDAKVELSLENIEEICEVAQPFDKVVRKVLQHRYTKIEMAAQYFRFERLLDWLLKVARHAGNEELLCKCLSVLFDNCVFSNHWFDDTSDIALEHLTKAQEYFSALTAPATALRFHHLLRLIKDIASCETREKELEKLKSALRQSSASDDKSVSLIIQDIEEQLRFEKEKNFRCALARNAIRSRDSLRGLEIWSSIVEMNVKLSSEERANLLLACRPTQNHSFLNESSASSTTSADKFSHLAIYTLESFAERSKDLTEADLEDIREAIRANKRKLNGSECFCGNIGEEAELLVQFAAFFKSQTGFWKLIETKRAAIIQMDDSAEKLNLLSEMLYCLEKYALNPQLRSPKHEEELKKFRHEIKTLFLSHRTDILNACGDAFNDASYVRRLRCWHAIFEFSEEVTTNELTQVLDVTDSLGQYVTEKMLLRMSKGVRMEYVYRALSLLKFCLERADDTQLGNCIRNITNNVADRQILCGSLTKGDFTWNLECSLTDLAFQRLVLNWKTLKSSEIRQLLEKIDEKLALLDTIAKHQKERKFKEELQCWLYMQSSYPLSSSERSNLRHSCKPLKEQSSEDDFEKYESKEIIDHSELAIMLLIFQLNKENLPLPGERSEALEIASRNQQEVLRYLSTGDPFERFHLVDFIAQTEAVFSKSPVNNWERIKLIKNFTVECNDEGTTRNLEALVSEVEEYECEHPHQRNHRSKFELAGVKAYVEETREKTLATKMNDNFSSCVRAFAGGNPVLHAFH